MQDVQDCVNGKIPQLVSFEKKASENHRDEQKESIATL